MKQIMIFFLSIIMGAFIFSCKESGTNPPEEKPPGYQVDIPWPSLADSPWPMFRADPQNSGRSKFIGASLGQLKYEIDSINMQEGIIFLGDSSISFLAGEQYGYLYNYKSENLRWKLQQQSRNVTPTVTSQNKILLLMSNKFLTIDMNGQLAVSSDIEQSFAQKGVFLDKAGFIYFVANNKLYKMDQNGNIIWSYTNTLSGVWTGNLSFSPDGNNLFIPGIGITCFDLLDLKIMWHFGSDYVLSSLIDNASNIYFFSKDSSGKHGLITLDKTGKLKRIFYDYSDLGNESFLAMDKNGNTYFTAGFNFYSLNYDGQFRFTKSLPGISSGYIVIDRNNNIFTTVQDGYSIRLLIFNADGDMINQWISEPNITTGNGLSVGVNEILIPTWDSGKIFSIK